LANGTAKSATKGKMKITIENDIVIFDEFDIADDNYSSSTTIKKLFDCGHIEEITFISAHSLIRFYGSLSTFNTFYTTNPDCDLLDYMCKIPALRKGVKHYYLRNKEFYKNIEAYPILIATILGNSE